MAFQKKTWLARLGQGLNKFIFNGGSKVTLDSSPDLVTQEGTPLSAENMNDLEDRIDSEFTNVNGAITSLNTTVTNLGSLAIESKTSGRTLDQISSYLVDNLETFTPVKGRFYQYMVQFTDSPSGYVHLQIGSRETGVGYGYAYSMDYVVLYYFTISGGTCYLRKVANA